MTFIRRPTPWVNNDDVFPEDLNRYEDALEDHENGLADMTKVEASITNGNIKVNGSELQVYRILNDLVNNLESDDTNKALAAAQGKALAEQISISSGQIAAINARTQISTYTTLEQLGLTDAQFSGLTQVQAFDLLLTKLTRQKMLYMRTDSSINNFRTALGSIPYGTILKVEVYAFERYVATVYDSDYATSKFAQCVGFPTVSSPWTRIAVPERENISLLNGWINYSTSVWGFAGATRVGDNVQLSGLMSSGTKTAGTVLGTLPNSFKPAVGKKCLTYAYSGSLIEMIGLSITTSGNIVLDNAVTGTYLSLCGVSFSIN